MALLYVVLPTANPTVISIRSIIRFTTRAAALLVKTPFDAAKGPHLDFPVGGELTGVVMLVMPGRRVPGAGDGQRRWPPW